MKRLTHLSMVACAIISALMLAVPLGGCTQKKKYRIGVSQNSYDDWRTKLNDEIRREMLLHGDAEVEILSADGNTQKQISDIRSFIDKDVDVIIASPLEEQPLTPVFAEAIEHGIPVVMFDRRIEGPYFTAFVGADNRLLGRASARWFASRLQPGDRVVEITGLWSSSPARERHDAFREILADSAGVEIAGIGHADWTPERARVVADSLLRLYPDVKGIFAQNDRMAIAARNVADSLGLKDILITGIDAVPGEGIQAVADGKINATFLYPTGGSELVRTALDILNGEDYEDNKILSSASPVDASNAQLMLLLDHSVENETGKVAYLKDRVDEYSMRHDEQTVLLIAIAASLVLLAVIFFILLNSYWEKKRVQQKLSDKNDELTRQRDELTHLNDQLRDATQAKLVFFTNVSHDLRTPLTLISEPIAQLREASNLTGEQRTLIRLADKNTKILQRLINQILDFRKYENGKLDLALKEVYIADTIEGWMESFRPLARKKHLKLGLEIDLPPNFHMAVDPEKLERIFFNLMSNAFRFTPANGEVKALINLIGEGDGKKLRIEISDTGKGMTQEETKRVFERFYRADSVLPEGSGIGLALVKSFVDLHGGNIRVESEPGKGSRFIVELPAENIAMEAEISEARIDSERVQSELSDISEEEISLDPTKPCVLVIDDTSDLRTLLRTLLEPKYQVIEASGGRQGVKLAAKFVPDLIICDVMMPDMDGMACLEAIKAEPTTSRVPVLMLTACSLDEQRAEGYRHGADGYLAKPFDSKVLLARIESLVKNRSRLEIPQTPFASMALAGIPSASAAAASQSGAQSKQTPQSADSNNEVRTISQQAVGNEFFAKFMEIVEANIANAEISVEEIGRQMGLGRVQFYRKIKQISNYSPNEVLRITRLRHAYKMLASQETTVAEVAYNVGFSSPSYFSKCFREYYNELPADVQKRTSKA